MIEFLTIAALLIGCFICITNFIYGKVELKNYSTWRKNSALNSPTAWMIYGICLALMLGGVFVVSGSNVLSGFMSAGKQQNAAILQQNAANQQDTNSQDNTVSQ